MFTMPQRFTRPYPGPLKQSDPAAFLDAYIEWNVQECSFIRPALWASMELGVPVFRDAIHMGIEAGLSDFVEPLRGLAPELGSAEMEELGRSLRRLLFASLMDRDVSADELRRELAALISGYRTNAVAASAGASG